MANAKYLAGPGGRFDLADPDTKRMVQAVMANPADAPKYGASLAEIFQLQKMLERISTPMPAPQTKTVYDDLKNAALQQASSGMLGQQQQQPMAQEPMMQAAHGGLMGLPVHNFREENYAGGGIVAFNGKDNDQVVSTETGEKYQRFAPSTDARGLVYPSLLERLFNPNAMNTYNEMLARRKGQTTARDLAMQNIGQPATTSEELVSEPRTINPETGQAYSPVRSVPSGLIGEPTAADMSPERPVRPVRPAGLPAAPAAPALAAPAAPSQGEARLKAAQEERNKRVDEARPKDRAAYRSEIEEEYKAAGIGGADKAEKERIAEQRARAKEQYGKNIDLAGFMAGMKMAAAASRRGATFLGSAAEGGSEFGARYGKAMEDMSAMQAKLDEKETNLARLEEARKMGIIDKTDARLKEARAEYKTVQDQALNLQEKSAQLVYGKEVQEQIAKLDRESRERVANLQVAATREGHYNAFRDLMSRLDKAPPEQHAAIIAQFEKASGAVGAGYAADRRAENTRALAFQRDPQYKKLSEELARLYKLPTSNPTIKKQIADMEAKIRAVKAEYGADGAGTNTAYTAGDNAEDAALLKKYGL